MYGLYGLKHHTVEMSRCGTDERTNERTNDKQTREDKATQPLDAGRLSFAKMVIIVFICDENSIYNHFITMMIKMMMMQCSGGKRVEPQGRRTNASNVATASDDHHSHLEDCGDLG